jgi:hypothetical protein
VAPKPTKINNAPFFLEIANRGTTFAECRGRTADLLAGCMLGSLAAFETVPLKCPYFRHTLRLQI